VVAVVVAIGVTAAVLVATIDIDAVLPQLDNSPGQGVGFWGARHFRNRPFDWGSSFFRLKFVLPIGARGPKLEPNKGKLV